MNRLRNKLKFLMLGTAFCAVTSMMFAFIATMPANCDCSQESMAAKVSTESCCLSKPETRSCCSQKAKPAKRCCCNPENSECQCSDCSCGEVQDAAPIQNPVPPSQETIDLVMTGVVGEVSEFATAWEEQNSEQWSTELFPKHFLSAQQTCVILSRFNC